MFYATISRFSMVRVMNIKIKTKFFFFICRFGPHKIFGTGQFDYLIEQIDVQVNLTYIVLSVEHFACWARGSTGLL